MKNIFILLISILLCCNLPAQTYDPLAVQRINDLIANNGLQATPNAPETWEFAFWNDENPKTIRELSLHQKNLFGNISLAELKTLYLLDCHKNYNITKLDLTNCIQLQYLVCECNTLNELDLTNCFQMILLDCYTNSLTELNLSNFTQLKRLKCNDNELTKLNLTNCTQLEQLDCEYNNLTELDVSSCKQVRNLECSNNQLTQLDVTNCTQLYNLFCNDNKITELYMTNGDGLVCRRNGMTKLDVTNCTKLKTIRCEENNLTELVLTGLDNFSYLVGDNQKASFTLYKNEENTYNHSIILNAPTFGNTAISYTNGMLESMDSTVASTCFTVQTGKTDCELSGNMYFTYATIGINTPNKVELKVYPNPTTGQLTVVSYQLSVENVEVFDIYGRKQKAESRKQKGEGSVVMDISHLVTGIYFVKIYTETGEVVRKVVKN